MDSMDVNKAVAAALIAGIAFFVTGVVGDQLVRVQRLGESPLAIASMPAATNSAPAPVAALPPIAALLATADPGAGEALAKKVCAICHSFTLDGKAGIGPNLYSVVGSDRAAKPGFSYSNALKEKKGLWTYDELNHWLAKPSAYAPGTRMGFAGLNSAQDRANVIDYLHTLSANPMPLPDPKEAIATPAAAAAVSAPAAPPTESLGALLASVDPKKGQADTMKYACFACHSFTDGGKAGIGPNLWNVVNGPHAHMPGFAYSDALKAKAGPWTYAELDAWLTKPSVYAPGTKMVFAGLPDPKARAEIISYLRSLSADPAPLPAP